MPGQHQGGNPSHGPLPPTEEEEIFHMIKSLPVPFPPKKMMSWPKNYPFLSLTAPVSHPSSYQKLPFGPDPQRTLPAAGRHVAQCIKCLIKPIRSSNLLGWILFLTGWYKGTSGYWKIQKFYTTSCSFIYRLQLFIYIELFCIKSSYVCSCITESSVILGKERVNLLVYDVQNQ